MRRVPRVHLTTPRARRIPAFPKVKMPRKRRISSLKIPSLPSPRRRRPGLPIPAPKAQTPWWMYPLEGLERVGHLPYRLAYPSKVDMSKFRKAGGYGTVGGAAESLRQIPGRIPHAAASLIPFGKTLGVYKDVPGYQSPYELGSGTARSVLVSRGHKPGGAAVKWGGRVAGIGLDLPTDILMWVGVPAATIQSRATKVGKVFGAIDAPGRGLAKYVTRPAARAVSKVPGLRYLGKPISSKAIVTAPFRFTGAGINKMAARKGVLGATARGLRDVGRWFKKNLTFGTKGGKIEQQAIRDYTAATYHFEHGVNVLDKPGYRELMRFARSPYSTGRLARFLDKIGPARAKSAILEISERVGKNKLPSTVMSVIESGHLAKSVRGLGLSDDAGRTLLSLSGEFRDPGERLLRIVQKELISRRAIDPTTRRELEKAFAWKGRRPLSASELHQVKGMRGKAGKYLSSINEVQRASQMAKKAIERGQREYSRIMPAADALTGEINKLATQQAKLAEIARNLKRAGKDVGPTRVQISAISSRARNLAAKREKILGQMLQKMQRQRLLGERSARLEEKLVDMMAKGGVRGITKTGTGVEARFVWKEYGKMVSDLEALSTQRSRLTAKLLKAVDDVSTAGRETAMANKALVVVADTTKRLKSVERNIRTLMNKRGVLEDRLMKWIGTTEAKAAAYAQRADIARETAGEIKAGLTPLQENLFPESVAEFSARAKRKLGGVMEGVPTALRSKRVGHVPHVYDEAGREYIAKHGLWGKWTEELKQTLVNNSPQLSKQEIANILTEAEQTIQKMRIGGGEWHRLPITRHMTAAELNAAAWRVGLPGNIELVSTHAGLAYGVKGLKRVQKVGALRGARQIGEAIDAAPALREANTKLARYLDPVQVANQSHARPWRAGIMQGTGPLEGYYLIPNAREGWKLADKDLAESAANYLDILTGQVDVNKFLQGFTRAYDKFHSGMKSLALNYSLGYHFRNWIDDTGRMIVGEGPATVADGFDMAATLQNGGRRTFKFADGAQMYDLARLDGELASAGKIGGMFRAEAGAKKLGAKISQFNVIKRGSQALGEFGENFRAEALYMGVLNKYRNLPAKEAVAKAAQSVRDVLFAYPEITKFEKMLPARGIFFYRFMRKSIPFHVKAFLEHPFRQIVIMKLPSQLMGVPEAPSDAYMPEFLRQRGGFPIRRDGPFTTYSMGLGLSQFDTLAKISPESAPREMLGGLAPAVRIPLEAISGKQFFIDMNIRDRNRVYNKQTADALGLLDKALSPLTKTRLVHKYERNGKEYWVVPGHILWGLSQFRPLNDIRKILAMVAPSGEREGNVGNAVLWAATGAKSFNVNIEAQKRRKELEEINEMNRQLMNIGVMRELRLPYTVKGIKGLTPYEKWMTEQSKGRTRTISREARAKARSGAPR